VREHDRPRAATGERVDETIPPQLDGEPKAQWKAGVQRADEGGIAEDPVGPDGGAPAILGASVGDDEAGRGALGRGRGRRPERESREERR
jgi:hypothetical protein